MLAVSVCAPSSRAATVQEAITALKAEQYAEALDILRPLADNGDAQAQYWIGEMNWEGRGLPRNLQAGCDWYEKAADQRLPAALYVTAMCYRKGVRGPVDYERAAFWLKKAVEKGITASKCPLGELFAAGNGVERNDETAFELCRQAATEGDASAQGKLGHFYLLGRGTDKDTAKGAVWLERGAKGGDAVAQYSFARLLAGGQGVPQDQNKSDFFFRAAADQGFGPAQFSIGSKLLMTAIGDSGQIADADHAVGAYIWLVLSAQYTSNPAERYQARQLTEKLRASMPPDAVAAADNIINEWRPAPHTVN
jgi:TPR repeat protein